MKKEVAIAIIIGFAIGLVITFGIYRAQKAYQQAPVNQDTQPQSSQQTPQNHSLTISSPPNESIQDTPALAVTGNTSPNSYLAAVTTTNQAATQADAQGQFSLEIELDIGANLVTFTSITPSGESASTDLTVTYSTANLNDQEDLPEEDPQDNQNQDE